jgi:hypothetical protein
MRLSRLSKKRVSENRKTKRAEKVPHEHGLPIKANLVGG